MKKRISLKIELNWFTPNQKIMFNRDEFTLNVVDSLKWEQTKVNSLRTVVVDPTTPVRMVEGYDLRAEMLFLDYGDTRITMYLPKRYVHRK